MDEKQRRITLKLKTALNTFDVEALDQLIFPICLKCHKTDFYFNKWCLADDDLKMAVLCKMIQGRHDLLESTYKRAREFLAKYKGE